MEILVSQFKRRLTNISLDLVRECINEVAWDERLSAIIGPRGVGKTTLILQYIKQHYADSLSEVLYATAESLYFAQNTLVDLAERFVTNGGN